MPWVNYLFCALQNISNMKKFILSTFILGALIIQACTSQMNKETYSKYQTTGNEISTQAQATLLANVSKAIQTGGPEYAVEFCNLEVSGIVDSLNNLFQCDIGRISDKNRNVNNSISSKEDQIIWQIFANTTIIDTVVQDQHHILYYKRINTAMPACLKCHGVPGSDINEATAQELNTLYPDDQATGYKLNDFRGLWKIRFDQN